MTAAVFCQERDYQPGFRLKLIKYLINLRAFTALVENHIKVHVDLSSRNVRLLATIALVRR